MKKLFVMLALLGLGLIHATTFANNKDISIAVVNVAYLMKNAPDAELASQSLKAEFSPREKALQEEQERIKALEAERDRNKSKWSPEEVRQAERQIRSLQRERTRALEDFREELRFARDSALDEVQRSVFQAIEEVRMQRNIDIIIQEYVAASDRVNLTDSVLEYLQTNIKKKSADSTSKVKQAEQ